MQRVLQATEDLLSNQMLFCPGKSPSCQRIDSYKSCNLGRIPTQVFIGKKEFVNGDVGILTQRLLAAGTFNEDFLRKASKVGQEPFWLITPGTKEIRPVQGSFTSNADSQFVENVRSSIQYATSMGSELSEGSSSSSSSSSGGLSTGAIVGIVIGAVIGSVAIIGSVVFCYSKKKEENGWQQYQDAVKNLNRL